jgi:ABC-type phosphate/phosphonate transport system substrate-binding protein
MSFQLTAAALPRRWASLARDNYAETNASALSFGNCRSRLWDSFRQRRGRSSGGSNAHLGIITATNRSLTAEHFTDFVRYLAAKLTSASDIEGKVVIAPTAFNLARLIEQRQIDFYMDSPYPTYLVNDVQGVVKLLLRRCKRGMAEYRSLTFTKTNGAINRLEDLRGKVLVFKDPESTSGYFLPKSPQLSPRIRTGNG